MTGELRMHDVIVSLSDRRAVLAEVWFGLDVSRLSNRNLIEVRLSRATGRFRVVLWASIDVRFSRRL